MYRQLDSGTGDFEIRIGYVIKRWQLSEQDIENSMVKFDCYNLFSH